MSVNISSLGKVRENRIKNLMKKLEEVSHEFVLGDLDDLVSRVRGLKTRNGTPYSENSLKDIFCTLGALAGLMKKQERAKAFSLGSQMGILRIRNSQKGIHQSLSLIHI
mgnify:CR=1 FL=1